MLESIGRLRDDMVKSNGLRIPKIHVIDNLSLPENAYEVHIQGVKVRSGTTTKTTELISSLHDAVLENTEKTRDSS